MRNTFASGLVELARKDKRVFLITGDLGFSVLEPFANEFPDRFLNIGIAEQNMAGVAAGLAKEGYSVYIYSIGNFPTLRCLEQIRYDICYHNLNVKVVAVGSGYAYGPLGVSHHTTEDLGILRTVPNLLVTSPADAHEVSSLLELFSKYDGPAYLRLNKAGEPKIHTAKPHLEVGVPLQVLSGKNKLVLSTGAIAHDAYVAAEKNGWSFWTFPMVSPINIQSILPLLEKHDEVITMEEHQSNSGFGSAILEVLSDAYSAGKISQFPRVKRIAIPNKFVGVSGSQEYLKKQAGLSL